MKENNPDESEMTKKKKQLTIIGYLSGVILMFPGFILAVGYSLGNFEFEPSYHIPIVLISYSLAGLIPGIFHPRRMGFMNLISLIPLVGFLIIVVLFHQLFTGWFTEEIELNVYLTSTLIIPIMSLIGSFISPKSIKSVFEDKNDISITDEN